MNLIAFPVDPIYLQKMQLKPERILLEVIVGSRAYGLAVEGSDSDIKGVYAESAESLLTLNPPADQIEQDRGNVVYYALRRFLALALAANPTIIEMLFMPEDCILRMDHAFELLVQEKDIFITRQAYWTHVRYAESQIRKARGRNKWINNPQPERCPGLEAFCHFIRAGSGVHMPFRPQSLSAAGVELSQCHASSVEHSRELYRLYHYGESARGVIRGGQIVCESIPIEDERERCIGLLLFNRDAYERAVRDHGHYWQWRKNRNEARWESQESGNLDYDSKNMMHLFRLMLSAEQILTLGKPLVRFSGEQQTLLLNIRNGQFSYQDLISKAEVLMQHLEKLYTSCKLPEQPDTSRAEALLSEITRSWQSRRT